MSGDVEKEQEEGKIFSKQTCEKEGATVAASPYLSSAGSFVGRPFRQRSTRKYPNHRENPINYQKCPTNATPAIFRHLID
jgi:hypothetical protein